MVNKKKPAQGYKRYRKLLRGIADIRYAAAVLQWDQETYMPPKGVNSREQQIATLSATAHKLFTNQKTGSLLDDLLSSNELTENERRNVELSLDDFKKAKKLPSEFVRSMSIASSQSFQYWIQARKANSFGVFEKSLDNLFKLKIQQAEYLGYEKHPYDALLNDYERGCTVELLDNTFLSVRQPLIDLLDKIRNSPQVSEDFLHRHFPRNAQWDFGMELVRKLGFDFDAGRQDISEHPFTTNFSSKDVRITTRIDENNFGSMTWSCIHELGHALYEQGLPDEEYGLPLGEYASLSIHESQSRLWENNVGRSSRFWNGYFPTLVKHFPDQFENIDVSTFYKGINKVQPTFIRTEADELTYHFHVMIRYELEKMLVEQNLSTKDIPAFWNEKYHQYLGLTVPDDKTGCLQDVHWSHGSLGYFPTYSLGSFYAAQFYASAKKQLNSLEDDIANGETNTLLNWLRVNVHQHGRKYTSEQLCEQISGETLNVNYFLENVTKKYQDIYNFKE